MHGVAELGGGFGGGAGRRDYGQVGWGAGRFAARGGDGSGREESGRNGGGGVALGS